jgi:uncharacterized SAM-binding protein YcdF (DUF218 family)
MFFAKKIFSVMVFPLTLFLGLLIIGMVLLRFSAKQATGRFFVVVGILLFILLSFEGVPYLLLLPLEYHYKPLYEASSIEITSTYPDVKWIVVLSGGHTSSPEIPLTLQGTRVTTVRLVEGIRLLKIYPYAKLLVSGGNYFGKISDADVMFSMAKDLGVSEHDIVMEKDSKDTEEQAVEIQQIVRADRCILVTSAAHMVRAVALFRKQGVNPIPAPTDYLVKTHSITDRFFYPNEESLLKTRTALHEYVGIFWVWLKGKI